MKHVWKANRRGTIVTVLIGVTVLALGLVVVVGGSLVDPENVTLLDAVTDFYANAGIALISIAITVLTIDALNRHRTIQQEKRRLSLQMGSPYSELAAEALRVLRLEGWLEDGSLEGARLDGANLHTADLTKAGLKAARLWSADLQKARLNDANLRDASLFSASLQGASLKNADLQGAELRRADLQRAVLLEANLRGAELWYANLQEADVADVQLVQTDCLRGATMPDGSHYDGRFNLTRDVGWARGEGIGPNDPKAMAGFYGVSLQDYLYGQAWAEEYLQRLHADAEAWYRQHWSGGEYRR
jgi:hypothetical protein